MIAVLVAWRTGSLPGEAATPRLQLISALVVSPLSRTRRSSGAVITRWRSWPVVLDPDRTGRTLRDQQRAECFDVAGAALRVALARGLDSAARAASIASSSSDLPLRRRSCRFGTVDLDHRDPRRREVPGQAGTVGAGAFDPDPLDRAERPQPRRQRVIARRRRRERLAHPTARRSSRSPRRHAHRDACRHPRRSGA